MDLTFGIFANPAFRRFLGMSDQLMERRVVDLPNIVERRHGPVCEECGFGTLRIVPAGRPYAGLMACDRAGCGATSARATHNAWESMIRAS